jgi:hypothetical protein
MPERLLQPHDVAEAVCAALAAPRTAEITDIYNPPDAALRECQTGEKFDAATLSIRLRVVAWTAR